MEKSCSESNTPENPMFQENSQKFHSSLNSHSGKQNVEKTLEDAETELFSGVTHPQEPVDTDLIRTVYVSVDQNKSSGKGPYLEDLSIRAFNEETDEEKESKAVGNTSSTDPEEKECIWDASFPPTEIASPQIDRSDRSTNEGVITSTERSSESAKRSFKGESVESAKTSLSRASDSSGVSDESNWSNFTGSSSKPHKGNDPRWKAILAVRTRDGLLGMSHFRLLKRLGCGDIGSVYLSELSGTRCYFAMKVMDKASLASRKKLTRAQTEREILQLLDHPFLPTLYTHFETERFSCLVMEFCPGGDLHTLRQRQQGKYFSEYAARYSSNNFSLI